MAEASALVTAEGARTSHAAVVARQLGKVCIIGCTGLSVGRSLRKGSLGGEAVTEGEIVSVMGERRDLPALSRAVSERPTDLLALRLTLLHQ